MTQIKKVKTSEGVQFYPQTHTKAVIDDNGYTAESRLGAMQDEINNLQEGVVVVGEGMTPVPSDLYPSYMSSNWVASGGVFNATTISHTQTLNIASIYETKAYIGPENTWSYVGSSNYRCIMVSIAAKDRLVITANASSSSYYAFLSSGTVTANASPNFATGETGRHIVASGETVDVEIPGDAAVLYIATYSAGPVAPQYAAFVSFDTIRDIVWNPDESPSKGSNKLITSGGVYNSMVQSALVLGEEEDMKFSREDYTDYEYLFCSNEYADAIELPFDPTYITHVEGSFSRTGIPNIYERILGNYIAENARCIRVINNKDSQTTLVFNFNIPDNYSKFMELSSSENVHTFSLNWNTYTLDSSTEEVTNHGNPKANTSHLYVFPGYSGGCDYKIYTLYITYNGNLHTLTPAKNPLGVYGFYDEYDNEFYASNNHYITGGN